MSQFFLDILNAPLDSPTILVLSVAYFLVASIRIYDVRLVQAKERGDYYKVAERAGDRTLPEWVNAFHWLGWILFITLLILNWSYALALYAVLFVLRVLPVSERIGEILMSPFLRKK